MLLTMHEQKSQNSLNYFSSSSLGIKALSIKFCVIKGQQNVTAPNLEAFMLLTAYEHKVSQEFKLLFIYLTYMIH